MNWENSTYEVLQILSILLGVNTCLTALFDKTKFNDGKNLDTPLVLGLLININLLQL